MAASYSALPLANNSDTAVLVAKLPVLLTSLFWNEDRTMANPKELPARLSPTLNFAALGTSSSHNQGGP
jgi:hypothetical protein